MAGKLILAWKENAIALAGKGFVDMEIATKVGAPMSKLLGELSRDDEFKNRYQSARDSRINHARW